MNILLCLCVVECENIYMFPKIQQLRVKSLSQGKCQKEFKTLILNDDFGILLEIALRWIPVILSQHWLR